MSERCKWTSERTSEWPSVYVPILGCSAPLWHVPRVHYGSVQPDVSAFNNSLFCKLGSEWASKQANATECASEVSRAEQATEWMVRANVWVVRANVWAVWANEWTKRANEQMDEQAAQHLRLNLLLFWTTVVQRVLERTKLSETTQFMIKSEYSIVPINYRRSSN